MSVAVSRPRIREVPPIRALSIFIKHFKERKYVIYLAGTLTQAEADKLIQMLKKTVEEQILFPIEKGGVSFHVIGERRGDEFIINIDRKGKMAEKCTYQGRVQQSNQVLMRLDIDPNGRHTNPEPDGRLIIGNHLHIYCEEHDMKFAIPFDPEDKGLYELCYTFFEKFHIIEPPEVFYQETI